MRYEVKIHAYDLMDTVCVTTRMWESCQTDTVSAEVILATVGIVVGVGESNPEEWLKDVLVAILETL